MQGNVTVTAANSWLDYMRKAPKQVGLDHPAQAVRHLPNATPPALDVSATQTQEQRAIAEGLKELELLKRSTTSTKGKT